MIVEEPKGTYRYSKDSRFVALTEDEDQPFLDMNDLFIFIAKMEQGVGQNEKSEPDIREYLYDLAALSTMYHENWVPDFAVYIENAMTALRAENGNDIDNIRDFVEILTYSTLRGWVNKGMRAGYIVELRDMATPKLNEREEAARSIVTSLESRKLLQVKGPVAEYIKYGTAFESAFGEIDGFIHKSGIYLHKAVSSEIVATANWAQRQSVKQKRFALKQIQDSLTLKDKGLGTRWVDVDRLDEEAVIAWRHLETTTPPAPMAGLTALVALIGSVIKGRQEIQKRIELPAPRPEGAGA